MPRWIDTACYRKHIYQAWYILYLYCTKGRDVHRWIERVILKSNSYEFECNLVLLELLYTVYGFLTSPVLVDDFPVVLFNLTYKKTLIQTVQWRKKYRICASLGLKRDRQVGPIIKSYAGMTDRSRVQQIESKVPRVQRSPNILEILWPTYWENRSNAPILSFTWPQSLGQCTPTEICSHCMFSLLRLRSWTAT